MTTIRMIGGFLILSSLWAWYRFWWRVERNETPVLFKEPMKGHR